MKILILGGTVFLGRHLVEAAQARGHEVTLFNRGEHNPELFPDLEKLRGDRKGDLSALAGRQWDAVIDPSGYVPRVVRASAELLSQSADHYTFISSLSVYAENHLHGVDESGKVATIEDETTEEVTGETYGALKALSEQAAEAAMPGRVLNIRPGLIVGRYDPTDRFTYWPYRVSLGGETLAPERPDYAVQVIDVRDLAEWNIRMVEAGKTGVYNATGPDYRLSLRTLLETAKAVSDSDAIFTWVSADFLAEHNVQPWSEMPLWIPGEEYAGFHTISVQKAIQDGLTFRPLANTIADTLAWVNARPADHQWKAGISREREAELLGAWHQRGD
jgi:2'-hydroxyisoflavone reductase